MWTACSPPQSGSLPCTLGGPHHPSFSSSFVPCPLENAEMSTDFLGEVRLPPTQCVFSVCGLLMFFVCLCACVCIFAECSLSSYEWKGIPSFLWKAHYPVVPQTSRFTPLLRFFRFGVCIFPLCLVAALCRQHFCSAIQLSLLPLSTEEIPLRIPTRILPM